MDTAKKLDFNKNDKQLFFNRVRGKIEEINEGERWCSYTLMVGHENKRLVNFTISTEQNEKYKGKYSIGDKVTISFFLTSRNKNGRWHTSANILNIDKDDYSS
jgi:hypothetical protein